MVAIIFQTDLAIEVAIGLVLLRIGFAVDIGHAQGIQTTSATPRQGQRNGRDEPASERAPISRRKQLGIIYESAFDILPTLNNSKAFNKVKKEPAISEIANF